MVLKTDLASIISDPIFSPGFYLVSDKPWNMPGNKPWPGSGDKFMWTQVTLPIFPPSVSLPADAHA